MKTTSSSELPWTEVAWELPALEVEDAGDHARRSRRRERKASRRTRQEEDRAIVDEEEADQDTMRMFRRGWEQCFARSYGSFQDNTSYGPMRFTEGALPKHACCESVMQVFSVQVTELKDGLKWPLHVYGYIAIRDLLDHNRNLLFERKRDNCQILTQQDSCLLLTGPSRAVVIIDPVTFEVDLNVRGETESEDNVLCLKFFQHHTVTSYEKYAPIIRRCYSSKRSVLEFKFAVLEQAVEATVVSAKVFGGPWLDHYRGRVVCRTASASNEDIVLLDSRDGRMPVAYDGEIELSRGVVSVEACGQLNFCVTASQVGDKMDVVVAEAAATFTPKMKGKSRGTCDLGFYCKQSIRL
ncbi:unnamed protein product [Urochloa decumbens]|uniref:DUF6598 domain-containing protein n=1 Tax=Urochloa decumbens TaxID=240449 RepID=A0ABC9FT70_9POAL